MDTKVARDTIQIIRKERKRRLSRLSDHPDVANQQWRYSDEPFVNDLCLMLMVAIHHQVERELVGFAARMAGDGKPISEEQYQQRVQVEREYWRNRNTKRKVVAKLKLMSFSEWDTSMETLRLLANSNKHHPSGKPDEGLLKHLKLDLKRNYAPLPESGSVRKGLAASLNLQTDADYCAIAEELLKQADHFLAAVRQQPGLSKVKPRLLSLFRGHGEC